MIRIDLNCDLGESYGNFKVGNDEAVFPYISSCNVACGFHGGDPWHMSKTIELALKHGARIGAHPSYPDLMGFGRRKMDIPAHELKAIIKYQIAALQGMAQSMGATVAYVKPHGALYNKAANDEAEATLVIQAIQEMDDQLALMGLAGSLIEDIANNSNIEFIAEAFADRRYESNGRLMARSKQGAVIYEASEAVQQVRSIALEQKVQTADGNFRSLKAQSFCIHGDNPFAVAILEALRSEFEVTSI